MDTAANLWPRLPPRAGNEQRGLPSQDLEGGSVTALVMGQAPQLSYIHRFLIQCQIHNGTVTNPMTSTTTTE